jgi:hypothetical protein
LVKEIEHRVSIGKPYRFVKLIIPIQSIEFNYLTAVARKEHGRLPRHFHDNFFRWGQAPETQGCEQPEP